MAFGIMKKKGVYEECGMICYPKMRDAESY